MAERGHLPAQTRDPGAPMHPHALHAQAALWALLDADDAIPEAIRDEAIQRVPIGPPAAPPRRTRRALDALNALLRRERADRIHTHRAGITPTGGGPAPVRAELLDACGVAHQALVDAAWILASGLRHRPLLVWGHTWQTVWHGERASAVGYLQLALPHAPATTAQAVLDVLEGADTTIRAALRTDRPRQQLPGNPPCPGCDQRLLRVATAAPDRHHWTVTCAARCTCTGDTCPCQMTLRDPGVRHIWTITQAWATTATPDLPSAA